MHITCTMVKYSYIRIVSQAVWPSPGILIILQYLLCSTEGIMLIMPGTMGLSTMHHSTGIALCFG